MVVSEKMDNTEVDHLGHVVVATVESAGLTAAVNIMAVGQDFGYNTVLVLGVVALASVVVGRVVAVERR